MKGFQIKVTFNRIEIETIRLLWTIKSYLDEEFFLQSANNYLHTKSRNLYFHNTVFKLKCLDHIFRYTLIQFDKITNSKF